MINIISNSIKGGFGESSVQILNSFTNRVSLAGGVYESEFLLEDDINNLKRLEIWNKATAVWLPYGYKESRLYAIKGGVSADLVVSRASTKTRIGPAYLEEVPYNLLQNSNKLNTSPWIKLGVPNVSITENTIIAPDGTTTANKIVWNGGSTYGIRQTNLGIGPGTYTLQFWAKSPNGASVNVDISDLNNTIYPLTTEWGRYSLTVTISSGVTLFSDIAIVASGAVSGVTEIHVWGVQLVAGSEGREDYFNTTNRQNIPSLNYIAHTNLVQRSAELSNSYWGKTVPLSVVIEDQQKAPDTTLTAEKLDESANTQEFKIYRNNIKVSPHTFYTLSVHLKSAERKYAYLQTSLSVGMFFDLENGIALSHTGTAPTSYNIKKVENGWYRCSITIATGTATAIIPEFGVSYNGTSKNYAGTSGYGIYVWGVQFEKGRNATTYIPTATSIASRVSSPVLSVEHGRTNTIKYSEELDRVEWDKLGTTITANNTTAPTSLLVADKIYEVNGYVTPRISQPITTTIGGVYTASIFAKAGERNQIRIVAEGSGSLAAYYDLSNGVTLNVGSSATASIEEMVDRNGVSTGWYRCILTYTATLATTSVYIATAASGATIASGDATKGLYLWGGQFESGGYASSYIPTLSGSIARINDNISGNIPDLLDKTSISFIIDVYCNGGNGNLSGDQYGILISVNRLQLLVSNAGAQFYCNDGTSLTGTLAPVNQWNKMGVTWDGTIWKVFMNGVKVKEVAGASTAPFSSSSININHRISGWVRSMVATHEVFDEETMIQSTII